MSREQFEFFLIVGISLLFAGHAYWYYPFLTDDAMISLRYADRLLAGDGLTWTEGRPVEGYSNLLWILLVAGLGLMNIDLIYAARLLGLASTIATFTAVTHALRDCHRAAPLVALSFLCLCGPLAAWSIGGLEQPLLAALLAWSIALALPRLQGDIGYFPLSILLGMLCITRPDGPLFVAALVLARCLAKPMPSLATLARLLALPIVFYGGQLTFRLFYYGEWVPNTALAKISFTDHAIRFGCEYVYKGLWSLKPFSLFAAVAMAWLIWKPPTRASGLLFVILTASWLSYIACVGGDVFAAWRHFVPLLAIFALALGFGVDRALNRWRGRSAQFAGAAALAVACTYHGINQFYNPVNSLALVERWEWDGQVLGLMLGKVFGDQKPLYAVDNAGCLPYFSGLPALDMLGLNDYYLPRHPPPTFGSGFVGHELGDGDYLWRRRPDLISFGMPKGYERATFLGGRQMQALPDFYREYSMVRFLGRHPYPLTAIVWVLKYSEKIGIRDYGDRIEIPGFLFATQGNAAYLNDSGKLVVPITAEWPGVVVLEQPLVGGWTADIISSDSQQLMVQIQTPKPSQTRIALSTTTTEIIELHGMTLKAVAR